MNKLLLIIAFSVFSSSLAAFSYPNMGYVIEPDTANSLDVALKAGKSTTFKGEICLKRPHDFTGKMQCLPTYDKAISIRAFFPDATNEVTDQLILKRIAKSIAYEFATPALDATSENTLTIVVGPRISRIDQLLKIQAKLSKRIIYLDLVIEKYRPFAKAKRVIEILERTKMILQTASDKIAKAIDGNPDTLAKLVYPLQVNNNYAAGYYNSSMIGGFRLAISANLGSAIEGETTTVKTAVTNLNHLQYLAPGLGLYLEEGHQQGSLYQLKYSFRSSMLKQSTDVEIPVSNTHEDIFVLNKLKADDLNFFDLTLIKKRNGHRFFDWFKTQVIGTLAATLPVAEDNVLPIYKKELLSEVDNESYYKDMPTLSVHLFDEFGRIDFDSLKSSYAYTSNLGEQSEIDLRPLYLVQKVREGQEYKLSLSMGEVAEGHYSFSTGFADFAGNTPVVNPLQKGIFIDRTIPVITLTNEDHILTNNPTFRVTFNVADHSPTVTKVFVNDFEVHSTADKEVALDAMLAEGKNIIRVESVDAAGNVAVIKSLLDITLDTIPPTFTELFPLDNGKVFTLDYTFRGKANEPLSKVVYAGLDATVNGKSFSGNHSVAAQAIYNFPIDIYDLAGNKTSKEIQVEFILKILNKDLMSIVPKEDDPTKLIIKGGDWASRPGLTISVNGGFFKTKTITSDSSKGFFEVEMDFSSRYVLYASDNEVGMSETVTLNYNVDTTLSGVVKDIEDRPLRGVTVTIASSGQKALTDGNGVFKIEAPVTGDQEVVVDATTIPEEYLAEGRKYSKTTLAVNLGPYQLNTLTDTIYLSPLLTDGSQTPVESGVSTTVTSPHAPGVELKIEADSATFPDGTKVGEINMLTIPESKTSVRAPDYVKPESVVALEPSGLSFSKPVELTLPNVSEFPPGIEVVIMSKNSAKGTWEIDGVATVSEDGQSIKTNEGMGITHFSEVFAAPRGLTVSEPSGKDMPGADLFDGAVMTSIDLPTYKVLGKDIAPSLIYKSSWAHPTAVISNIIDIPRNEVKISRSGSAGNLLMKGSTSFNGKSWIEPEEITSTFYTGDLTSGKATFTGVPNRAKISYAVDMGSQSSGVQPYRAHYDVKLKQMVVGTITTKTKKLFGKTRIKRESYKDQMILDQIFPQDISGTLSVQNGTNSPSGAGWKIAGVQRILNPESPRMAVEEADGQLSYYSSNNIIQTLYRHNTAVKTFLVEGANALAVDSANKVYEVNTETAAANLLATIPPVSTGVYGYTTEYKTKKCSWGDCDTYWWCKNHDVPYQVKRDVRQLLRDSDGSLVGIDMYGSLFRYRNGETTTLAGAVVKTPTTSGNSNKNICNNANFSCTGDTVVRDWKIGDCPTYRSTGNYLQLGFADGTLGTAKFNSIFIGVSAPVGNALAIADTGNNAVRLVDLSTNDVKTIVGNRQNGAKIDNVPALQSSLYHPRGLVYDRLGNLYISTEDGYIRKVTPESIITTYAGKPAGSGGVLADLTFAEEAAFYKPGGMAIDSENNFLYVADTGNNRIVKIDMETMMAKTVAGNGKCDGSAAIGDGGSALDAQLCHPEMISLDTNGNLLIHDNGHNSLRRVVFDKTESGQSFYAPLAKDNSTLIKNADGTFERHYRNGMVSYFDNAGYQVRSVTRDGKEVSFSYLEGKLVEQTDPKGNKVTYNYGLDGKMSSIIDHTGRETKFSYQNGNLVKVEYPDNTTREFSYQGTLLTHEYNQKGISTEYVYNESNRLVKTIQDEKIEIGVDDETTKTLSNRSSSSNPKPLLSGDEESIATVVRDAKGIETTFKTDGSGFVAVIKDNEGKITSIERDGMGRPTRIENPDGKVSTFTYNFQTGDLVKKVDGDSGYTQEFQYDSWGNLLKQSDSLGNFVINTYNAQGLLTETVDHKGIKKTYYYDSANMVRRVEYPLGQFQEMTYDDRGNLETQTNSDNKSTWYFRDVVGNATEIVNSENQQTSYTFDLLNRLTSVTTPMSEKTSYFYDATGNLTTIVDPKNNQTIFNYDNLNRLTYKKDAASRIHRFEYDNNGQVTKEIDPNANTKIFEYDYKGQMIRKTLPDDVYELVYNDSGKTTSVKNKNTQIDYSYAKVLDKELIEEVNVTGLNDFANFNYALSFEFDAKGRLVKKNLPAGSNTLIYDSADRLAKIIDHQGLEYGFSYDTLNRLTKHTRPGSNTTFAYNTAGFLNTLVHTKAGCTDVINGQSLEYDFIGNKKKIITPYGNCSFDYDKNSQLTSATLDEISPNPYTFTYDSLGNMLTKNAQNFEYDDKFQYLKSDSEFFYAFDSNGNLIRKTSVDDPNRLQEEFIYSSENQLITYRRIEAGTIITESNYAYDALGRRLEKKVVYPDNSSKDFIRRFMYDGGEIVTEVDETNQVLANYTHSNLRTDDVLSVQITAEGKTQGLAKSQGNYFYLKDSLGTITDITDGSGNLIQHFVYSPFGEIIRVTNKLNEDISSDWMIRTSYTFTNREYDEESGLYYYRARYYDASTGRFLQVDPDPGKLSMPSTHVNKYIYVGNNPFNLADPSGMSWLKNAWRGAEKWVGDHKKEITITAIIVASALTGGAAAGALATGFWSGLAIGAGAGAITGGIIGGLGAKWQGKSFASGLVQGAIIGAVAGGIAGAAIAQSGSGCEEGAIASFITPAIQILFLLFIAPDPTGAPYESPNPPAIYRGTLKRGQRLCSI